MNIQPAYYKSEIVPERVGIENLSKFTFNSELAERMVKSGKYENGYPYEKLVESIKKYGFIPNFTGKTLHRDSFHYLPESFVVIEREDGTYLVPRGTHRFIAAMLAGLKKIPCYVQKRKHYTSEQLEDFRKIAEEIKSFSGPHITIYESWKFPGGSKYKGRDDSDSIFRGFNVPYQLFPGRSVLDIACSTGYFAIRAAFYGASYVEGFDVNEGAIEIAKKIAKAFNLKAKTVFKTCEFWDYKPDRQFDIVFCNQAIYHFTTKHRSKCFGNPSDVLDRISHWTKHVLLMYTYVDSKSPWKNPDEGYYPSSERLTDDLKRRGFKTVAITHILKGAKKHVVASRW